MKEALKRAIEGGYKEVERYYPLILQHQTMLLDPLFWQALGKAEGWPDNEMYLCPDCLVIGVGTGNHMQVCKIKDRKYPYTTYWHRLIDHLAQGKDVDSFFSTLLNK